MPPPDTLSAVALDVRFASDSMSTSWTVSTVTLSPTWTPEMPSALAVASPVAPAPMPMPRVATSAETTSVTSVRSANVPATTWAPWSTRASVTVSTVAVDSKMAMAMPPAAPPSAFESAFVSSDWAITSTSSTATKTVLEPRYASIVPPEVASVVPPAPPRTAAVPTTISASVSRLSAEAVTTRLPTDRPALSPTNARVSTELVAAANSTPTEIPPAEPPSALAVAVSSEVAATVTAPVTTMLSPAVAPGSRKASTSPWTLAWASAPAPLNNPADAATTATSATLLPVAATLKLPERTRLREPTWARVAPVIVPCATIAPTPTKSAAAPPSASTSTEKSEIA